MAAEYTAWVAREVHFAALTWFFASLSRALCFGISDEDARAWADSEDSPIFSSAFNLEWLVVTVVKNLVCLLLLSFEAALVTKFYKLFVFTDDELDTSFSERYLGVIITTAFLVVFGILSIPLLAKSLDQVQASGGLILMAIIDWLWILSTFWIVRGLVFAVQRHIQGKVKKRASKYERSSANHTSPPAGSDDLGFFFPRKQSEIDNFSAGRSTDTSQSSAGSRGHIYLNPTPLNTHKDIEVVVFQDQPSVKKLPPGLFKNSSVRTPPPPPPKLKEHEKQSLGFIQSKTSTSSKEDPGYSNTKQENARGGFAERVRNKNPHTHSSTGGVAVKRYKNLDSVFTKHGTEQSTSVDAKIKSEDVEETIPFNIETIKDFDHLMESGFCCTHINTPVQSVENDVEIYPTSVVDLAVATYLWDAPHSLARLQTAHENITIAVAQPEKHGFPISLSRALLGLVRGSTASIVVAQLPGESKKKVAKIEESDPEWLIFQVTVKRVQ